MRVGVRRRVGARPGRWPTIRPWLDVTADREDEALRCGGDLGNGGLEGLRVTSGGLPEAAHLAHVLASRGLDFPGGRGVVLATEGSDASAHGGSVPAAASNQPDGRFAWAPAAGSWRKQL